MGILSGLMGHASETSLEKLLDLDAELKIWLTGMNEPIKKDFKKDNNINEVYRILSKYVLI